MLKLALRPLELMQPAVELFQSQSGQNNRSPLASSRRSDSGARAKNIASERVRKNEGRLGFYPVLSLPIFFARTPSSECLG